MTDEARIGRLAALARKAWPHATEVDVGVEPEPDHDNGVHGFVDTVTPCDPPLRGRMHRREVLICHPRALDAIEAALLVLVDEPEAHAHECKHCGHRWLIDLGKT